VPLTAASALGLARVRLIWEAGRALGLIVLALTLAAALSPIVDLLDKRMPRTIAVVCVYLAGAGLIVAIGWFIIPDLAQEMQELAERSPQLVADMQQPLRGYLPPQVQLDQVLTAFRDQLLQIVRRAPMQLASFLFEVLIVAFLSLYS
jgi:predicted PurR-regulated permease PerM